MQKMVIFDVTKENIKELTTNSWSSILIINNWRLKQYLTGEETLLYNRRQVIERAMFTYSPLRKAFEKK